MVKGVVWQKAADHMRESLGPVGYETWIAPLNFIDLHERTAIIEAPNRFFRDWIKDHYLELMQQVLSTEFGGSVKVSLTVSEGGDRSKTPNRNGSRNCNNQPSKADATGTIPMSSDSNQAQWSRLHPELNPLFTFAEFVVGSSNQFAHAAALAVAERPGEKYNHFYLWRRRPRQDSSGDSHRTLSVELELHVSQSAVHAGRGLHE
jgi:chromosomal replication initiator protein